MAIPDHNHNHHNSDPNAYEDPIDQWLCSQCFKTISSSRPPNFNSENCSCIEVSSNGPPHTHHLPHPSSSPQPHYENTTHPNVLYQHTGTQSYASSAISFIGPEGPERKNPNLRVSNAYLPLGPGTGHGEVQHRRTASFESEMSPQMRRFLIEGGYDRTEHVGEEGFLKQDVKISASRKVHRGSKPSWVSSGSRGSGLEESFGGWSQRLDWTRETGAWMDEFEMGDGDVDLERGEVYEYPMIMSEVTECGFGDGGN